MKKLVSILLILISAACAQLKHGAVQPVVTLNLKQGIYFTSCSGAVEVWGNCFDKARETCPKGYDVTNKNESLNGGKREITFQCKK